MLKCFVVDDEALAIKVIENHLAQVPNIVVENTFTNALEAFAALQVTDIDLLFLDIQMPGLTGLSLLAALPNQPMVILTTAYREFAFESYEFRVIDYLLKPIAFDRFMKSMGKVLQIVNAEQSKTLSQHAEKIRDDQPFIYIKSERQFVKIWLKDLRYIESLRNHVRIFTDVGNYVTLVPITEMEQKLPPQRFMRIHKSYITALDKVEQFTATNIVVSGQTLPVGQVYQEKVLEVLGKHII